MMNQEAPQRRQEQRPSLGSMHAKVRTTKDGKRNGEDHTVHGVDNYHIEHRMSLCSKKTLKERRDTVWSCNQNIPSLQGGVHSRAGCSDMYKCTSNLSQKPVESSQGIGICNHLQYNQYRADKSYHKDFEFKDLASFS